MLPDTELLLIALSVLVALVVALRTLLALRSLRRLSVELRARALMLDELVLALPRHTARLRARLVEVNGEVEQGLWALSRVDGRAEAATVRMREFRGALDRRLGTDLASARRAVRRLRSAVRLLNQAITLRRTILG